jgi:uncharacterized protein (DUF433 family)
MTIEAIIEDFPELDHRKILAVLAYAAGRMQKVKIVVA